MELIQLVDVKETEGNYIIRVERDARPRVNRLYGCDIPAYPFTFDTLDKDIESILLETHINGIEGSRKNTTLYNEADGVCLAMVHTLAQA